MTWRSTKTYGHEEGLSACFRQWRATHSHCRYLHGYALAFRFTFEALELDRRNWVMDFGGLKPLKTWLKQTFDHKLVIAADDPKREELEHLDTIGAADVLVLEGGVGCERFAELAGVWVSEWLASHGSHVRCVEVECMEHGANSAIWRNP